MSGIDAGAVEAGAELIKCRGCGAQPGFSCSGLNHTKLHAFCSQDARAALTAAEPIMRAAIVEEVAVAIEQAAATANSDVIQVGGAWVRRDPYAAGGLSDAARVVRSLATEATR